MQSHKFEGKIALYCNGRVESGQEEKNEWLLLLLTVATAKGPKKEPLTLMLL